MSRRHHGRQRRSHREPGIIAASSCDACRHLIPGAEHNGDDSNMGIMHRDCASELLVEGWILTASSEGVDDITCVHYHLANWQGGHDGDCCGERT